MIIIPHDDLTIEEKRDIVKMAFQFLEIDLWEALLSCNKETINRALLQSEEEYINVMHQLIMELDYE